MLGQARRAAVGRWTIVPMARTTQTLLVVGILGTLTLAACGRQEERIAFDDQFFRAKLKRVDRQSDVFTIQVSPVSASIAGAREAGRYEATSYCINEYGTSDVIWTASPDAPDDALVIENDTLTLQGSCKQ